MWFLRVWSLVAIWLLAWTWRGLVRDGAYPTQRSKLLSGVAFAFNIGLIAAVGAMAWTVL